MKKHIDSKQAHGIPPVNVVRLVGVELDLRARIMFYDLWTLKLTSDREKESFCLTCGCLTYPWSDSKNELGETVTWGFREH